MQRTVKWISIVLLLAGGCWGLTVLCMSTIESARVYRDELVNLVSLAKLLACVFPVLTAATLIQLIRRAHSHGTASFIEHGLYILSLGLALGFLMAGLTVVEVSGLSAVVRILNFPASVLAFGWFSLGFGPHGDAGWSLFFWMPIFQWFLIFAVAYSIWLWNRRKTKAVESPADAVAEQLGEQERRENCNSHSSPSLCPCSTGKLGKG